jgi:hypothetical protein
MIERGTDLRISVSHPVLYRSHGYAEPQVCSSIDLSAGGSRLDRPYSLRIGDGVEISIAIPSRAIRCRGRVSFVSCLSDGGLVAAVQFQNLLKRDKHHLANP